MLQVPMVLLIIEDGKSVRVVNWTREQNRNVCLSVQKWSSFF